MKTALITGITGQDGSYLAEFLLSKGYKVVGNDCFGLRLKISANAFSQGAKKAVENAGGEVVLFGD